MIDIAILGFVAFVGVGSDDLNDPPPPMPRVKVSGDGKSFRLAATDQPFVPWGFNYLGRHEHLAEEDWETASGWKNIETDFKAMKALGGNVVRWHLQFETFMAAPDRPRPESLARLKKLLQLAGETGLYLDLTGLSCYRLKRVPKWYDELPEADRWKAQAKFWEAIAEACASHRAVFCYCLMNEPVVTEAKPGEHPWLTGELGGFHFVQRICNKPAGRDNKVVAEAWVNALVDAIRKRDKETLITVGVIPWSQVWPSAKPVFYAPGALRRLDFVSVHFYPKKGSLEKDLAALAVYDLGKPLVVEEIFPLACSMEDLDRFIESSKGRVDGWVAHYFGRTIEEHHAGAQPGGKIVAGFLEYWHRKGKEIARPNGVRN
jgi:hypothetical protein